MAGLSFQGLPLHRSAFWGYVGGLGTTIAVMNIFQAAQPALLYIVPAVLAAVGLHAHLRGEFQTVCMLIFFAYVLVF